MRDKSQVVLPLDLGICIPDGDFVFKVEEICESLDYTELWETYVRAWRKVNPIYGVLTGGELPKTDHLSRVLLDHGSDEGRHSWGPMLVLMALIGDEEAVGYRTVAGRATVDPDTGANRFFKDAKGSHKFVLKAQGDDFYKNMINRIL